MTDNADTCYRCNREYVICPDCEYPFCNDCCDGKCPDCVRRDEMIKDDVGLIHQFDEKGISMFDEMSEEHPILRRSKVFNENDPVGYASRVVIRKWRENEFVTHVEMIHDDGTANHFAWGHYFPWSGHRDQYEAWEAAVIDFHGRCREYDTSEDMEWNP